MYESGLGFNSWHVDLEDPGKGCHSLPTHPISASKALDTCFQPTKNAGLHDGVGVVTLRSYHGCFPMFV